MWSHAAQFKINSTISTFKGLIYNISFPVEASVFTKIDWAILCTLNSKTNITHRVRNFTQRALS